MGQILQLNKYYYCYYIGRATYTIVQIINIGSYTLSMTGPVSDATFLGLEPVSGHCSWSWDSPVLVLVLVL